MGLITINDTLRTNGVAATYVAQSNMHVTNMHFLVFKGTPAAPSLVRSPSNFTNGAQDLVSKTYGMTHQTLNDAQDGAYINIHSQGKLNARAGGTATWWSCLNAYNGCGIAGSMGLLGSGADLEMRDTVIVANQEYSFQRIEFTFPKEFSGS